MVFILRPKYKPNLESIEGSSIVETGGEGVAEPLSFSVGDGDDML